MAQGRVLDSRPRGRGFKPHQRHCVVFLSNTHLSLFILVQPMKTFPTLLRKMDWDVKNQIKPRNKQSNQSLIVLVYYPVLQKGRELDLDSIPYFRGD